MIQNPNKQGSGFINLKSYLQANPNAALGSKIGGAFNKDLDKSKASFGAAQGQLQGDLQKANIATPENQAQRDSILSKPEDVINDPAKTKQFNSFLNPTFNAPSADNLAQQAGQTYQMSQDFTNPAYKSNLLQRYVGQNNPYSMGQKTLDNVFLNTPGSNQALNQAKRGALQTMSQQRQAVGGAIGQIRQAKGDVEQFGKDTSTKLNERIGDYVDEKRGSIYKTLNDDKLKQDEFRTAVETGLKSGNISADLASRLGLSQGQSTYNLGSQLGSFVNNPNLTLSNVATPEERARVNALYQLRGETSPLDMSQAYVNPNDITGVNKEYIQGYLGKQEQGYNKDFGDFLQQQPWNNVGAKDYDSAVKRLNEIEAGLNNPPSGGVRFTPGALQEQKTRLAQQRAELDKFKAQLQGQYGSQNRANIT